MNLFWQAVGAFFTSPGFAGLTALCAAWLAWRGVRIRLDGDREMAREARAAQIRDEITNEARTRWWELAHWADHQIDAGSVREDLLLDLLVQMEGSLATREQAVMIECLAAKLAGQKAGESG